jgi:hypothetical protein
MNASKARIENAIVACSMGVFNSIEIFLCRE